MTSHSQPSGSGKRPDRAASGLSRRSWFAVGALGIGTGVMALASRRSRHSVFLARNQTYTGPLSKVIEEGFRAVEFPLERYRGKRVLLKPNLVEPMRAAPHMTTHPNVITATAEVFRRYGAEVTVGEAPGHVRDTMMALEESRVREALEHEKLVFADLNYEDPVWHANRSGYSPLSGIYFPESVARADLIVSLPKMKTHHWMGVTASMKNLYGTVPGIVYGWPKNVLHHSGIPETVCDINALLPPCVTVIDGIQCMEGDGPILGTPKQMGVLLVGTNLTAVDATVCRLMQVRPQGIPYLRMAAGRFGPIADRQIQQRGERWQESAQPFEILDEPHLKPLRSGELIS